MFILLRILGWTVAVALYAIAYLLLVLLVFSLVTGAGWLMTVLVVVVASCSVIQILTAMSLLAIFAVLAPKLYLATLITSREAYHHGSETVRLELILTQLKRDAWSAETIERIVWSFDPQGPVARVVTGALAQHWPAFETPVWVSASPAGVELNVGRSRTMPGMLLVSQYRLARGMR